MARLSTLTRATGTSTEGLVNRAMHSAKAVKSLTFMVYLGTSAGLSGSFDGGAFSLAAFLAFLRAAPFSLCEGRAG